MSSYFLVVHWNISVDYVPSLGSCGKGCLCMDRQGGLWRGPSFVEELLMGENISELFCVQPSRLYNFAMELGIGSQSHG